jgi:hypothetical protein
MKKLACLIVLLCATASPAQVSYWFSQWQKKGDAADVQAFFMWPGTNITFTYASNHVIINGAAGTNTATLATNAIYSQFATNWLGSLDRGIVTLPGTDPNVITVASASSSAANIILLTYLSPDGSSGSVQYQSINPGVSFDIRCSRANDAAGKVSWAIFKP